MSTKLDSGTPVEPLQLTNVTTPARMVVRVPEETSANVLQHGKEHFAQFLAVQLLA